MSAPLVGKRVVVFGTSREELNGQRGIARDYDREKFRYTVDLDNGQAVALKATNLEESSDPPPSRPVPSPQQRSSTGNTSCSGSGGSGLAAGNAAANGQNGPFGLQWPTLGLVLLGVAWLYQFVQGGSHGSGGGLFADGDGEEHDDRDEGYLTGVVREVVTLDQFKGALAHHSDNTGLPVVVDFFSHSCGPCRMIAPAFKRAAKQFKGEAVFLKVDVNRNYEASSACNIRGMPTFQFYLNKKKIFEFSGADERGLLHYTSQAMEKAQSFGTFVGVEVVPSALEEFYKKHDAEKVPQAAALAQKYSTKTALLMRVSRDKYAEAPRTSTRKSAEVVKAPGANGQGLMTKRLAEFSVEELQADLAALRLELERRGGSENARTGASSEDDDFPFLAGDDIVAEGIQKVVIIGGGPAGLAAAIYAARAGLAPIVVAPSFGGQLLGKGVDVENFPGVIGEHATGRGLVELMRKQALSFGARFLGSAVLSVDLSRRPLRVDINGTTRPLEAEALIVACGAESRWLNVQGEHTFRGNGVSSCATCDGFLFRGKDVAVVGGGDHAMEDALHLARTSRKVTVVHRRSSFRASRALAEKVLNHSSIVVRWDTDVVSFNGQDSLTHLTLQAVKGGPQERFDVSGAFVAIGHEPQTKFLKGQLELDEDGYIVVANGTATSIKGIFAAGDVADRMYRQAITASGTGVMAALDVERFLNEGD